MLTFDSLNPSSCGIVELDENNVVLNLYEKLRIHQVLELMEQFMFLMIYLLNGLLKI